MTRLRWRLLSLTTTAAVLAFALPSMLLAATIEVEKGIPPYTKMSGVSGSLNSIGSDTLNNLMTLWAEAFKKQYPNVQIQIEGKGSSTAPPALISGTAQIGPMSREMKPSEIDEFEKKFGYPPLKISVAIDALAVYVNKDNPLEHLTLPEVDAIYSKGRKCGFEKDIATWGDAGLEAWKAKPISMYGRNSASGTYGFFKEHALCNGDYKDTVKEQPGSASVVQGVAEDVYGIGYSGIGYRTSGVKPVALARKAGDTPINVDPAEVYAGRYPLARFLYLYINKSPSKPIDPLVREFVRYVLSRDGQEVVVKDGYLPLLSKVRDAEVGKLK